MTLCNKAKTLKVKLKAGGSIVEVRPLFTYDSKFLILASGSDVKVYSVQSGECVHVLKQHKCKVISVQENKGNPLQFYSCSEDGEVVKWDHSEGKVLQIVKLEHEVECFYAPSEKHVWFCVVKIEDRNSLYSVRIEEEKCVEAKRLFRKVYKDEKTIAFGNEGLFVATVYEDCLRAFNFDTKQLVEHQSSTMPTFVCVACHGSDFVVATGDIIGRILIWSNIWHKTSPIRSLHHWHTLPVSDLVFSIEGSHLYSGGGEAVLVKWNLFHQDKYFFPRLGAPICGLNVSKESGNIATSFTDNTIQIVNSQGIVTQVIQGLTQGHFQGSNTCHGLSTGLLYDSLRKAVVLNGKPGHLQFYDILEDKQLFNLDISGRNFVSQNREHTIFNTDVHRAAIDKTGRLLATAEYWNDEQMSPQIWLKFWEFDVSKQTFVLNTNVFLPHNKEINCVIFQTQVTPDFIPLLVTTSNDFRFKIWKLEDDSGSSDQHNWICDSMGCYREFPAGNASFSEDGSLLAVAFDKTATLWTVDVTNLKAALFHEKNKDKIKQLSFGTQSCCHLLLTHDGESITVWNVLSLSISWIVHNSIQVMVADMYSDIFAAFCSDRSLILFRPDNPEPIFYLKNASQTQIVSALFVPSKQENSLLKNSQLIFFDRKQNLWALSDDSESSHQVKKATVSRNLPATPFAMLQAESKVSDVATFEPQQFVNLPNEKMKIDLSCPTLVDPVALCSKVLRSLLISAPKKKS